IPEYVKSDIMDSKGMHYEETESLDEALPELDILYMTRIQRERFDDANEYERLKGSYILTPEKLQNAKADLSILHPLPRVNEISVAVDRDERACYFKQVLNGKLMRMALILKLLAETDIDENREADVVKNKIRCSNPRCIVSVEQELEHIFKPVDKANGIYRCVYCESQSIEKENN
ncbi:MAG: aspartate carbamoyltransferase, partial [Oscillospiraceae bacterium]|nr:aspartate carbamoyltransferase [Oscillospiraceae bacterium]